MDNNESLVKALSQRLAALKKICQVASFKTRKWNIHVKADLCDASLVRL